MHPEISHVIPALLVNGNNSTLLPQLLFVLYSIPEFSTFDTPLLRNSGSIGRFGVRRRQDRRFAPRILSPPVWRDHVVFDYRSVGKHGPVLQNLLSPWIEIIGWIVDFGTTFGGLLAEVHSESFVGYTL